YRIAGFGFADQVFGDTSQQRHFTVDVGGQHDQRRTQLVFQLIQGGAQGIHIGTVKTSGQHFHAVDVFSVSGQIRTGAGRQFGFQCIQLFFQLTGAGDHLHDFVADVISAAFQSTGNAVQRGFFTGDVIQRCLSDYRFDTTDTRRDAAFGTDFQQADITGAFSVCTTAQLNGEVVHTHGEYAHFIVVFFTKQCHGAGFTGVVDVHQTGGHFGVGTDLSVDNGFDLRDFFRFYAFQMREVKTQFVIRHQRAFLAHMLAQHFAQRRMQQVGRRVVNSCRLTFFSIHAGGQLIANFHTAFHQHAFVQMVFTFFAGVLHLEHHAIGFQETAVAGLTTAFGVEGGFVQHQNGFVASVQLLNRNTVFEQGFDRAGIFQLGVTEEFGAAVNFQTFAVIAGKVAGGAGHFTLLVHGGVKAVFVNFQVAFTGHVGSEV